jgi:hypothetical protein
MRSQLTRTDDPFADRMNSATMHVVSPDAAPARQSPNSDG